MNALYTYLSRHKTATLFFTFFLLTQIPASAQWVWGKGASATNNNWGVSVVTDPSGNVYVAGMFFGATITFGTTTLTNASSGSHDIFLVKYDANGNVIWAKEAGGADDDEVKSITTDAAGNIYMTGQFSSTTILFGSIMLSNSGFSDIYLAKYDASGNVLWAKTALGNNNDYSTCVTTDIDGNAFIVGTYDSPTLTFGTATITNNDLVSGTSDVFIAKYDAAGNVLWAQTGNGSSNDKGVAAVTDNAGNTYFAGNFGSPDITFESATLYNTSGSSAQNIFLVKYTSSGSVAWAKTAGGINSDLSTTITIDPSGNVYIAGYTSSPITFGATTVTGVFLSKYDTSGNVIWGEHAGSGDGYLINSLTADASGVYLAGRFVGSTLVFGTTTLYNDTTTTTDDIFLAKYNTSGNVLWATSAGGGKIDYDESVAVDGSGNLYITGYSTSYRIYFDTDFVINNSNPANMFVAKLNGSLLSTPNTMNINGNGIALYPNPGSEVVNLTIGKMGCNHIYVYDCAGLLVYDQVILPGTRSVQIDMGNKADGMYYLKAEGHNTTSTVPFAIMHQPR